MQKTKIKENYEYWYFEKQEDFFASLEELLNEGYTITDSIQLCVELTKEDIHILLSYTYVESVDESIKESLKALEKEYKKVYPNFEYCLINTIASIRKAYGGKAEYKTDHHIDEILKKTHYKNVVVMLLDGLGESILEKNLPPESFLKSHRQYTNTAIYPSTTAAATTATISGLSPARTGWLGWSNYFKEIKRNIVLFTGRDYYTDEFTGFNAYEALPYKPFYHDLEGNGSMHMPDFSKSGYTFKKVLKKSLKNFKKKKTNIQYVYYTQPDGLMHEFGTEHEKVKETLGKMDQDLNWYVKKLPKSTLLIISADHGHVDCKPIEFYACTTLQKMLNRAPANDSRCTTFSVKEEYRKQFPILFEQLFGYAFEIYPSNAAIHQGFFGSIGEEPCARAYDFLGDYVAVGKAEYYLNYKGPDNFAFKSHHAGITAEEMLIPMILYRK